MQIIKEYILTKNKLTLYLIISAGIGVAISYGDFYLFHLALFILSLVCLFELKENNYLLNFDLFTKKYNKIFLVIFSWYLISLFWTPDLRLGIKYLFYLFCGSAISLSIVYYSDSLKKIDSFFRSISILVFLEIFIGFFESFTSFRMPISSYSQMATFFGKEPINYDAGFSALSYLRLKPPTSFHWNTNDFAICMAISLPFFLCNRKIFIKIFGILLITVLTVMSASRAVFFGLIIIYTLYLFLIKKRIGTLVITWIISAILFLSIINLRNSENPRINEVANTINAISLYLKGEIDVEGSIEWRRNLVINGMQAFYKTYGLGLGAGGSVANQEIIGPVAGRFTSMHNFWIEILVEGGIVIAFIFFYWYSRLTHNLYKVSKFTNDNQIKYFSESLFLSMIAFVPSAVAASSTVYFFPMWIMFGFGISVISISSKIDQPKIF